MTRRRWITGMAAFLMVALIVALWAAIAADLGSQNDPLITVSYINELMPSLMRGLDERVAQKSEELGGMLDARYREAAAELELLIREFERRYADTIAGDEFIDAAVARIMELMMGGEVEANADWAGRRVDVANGRTLVGRAGTQIMLRTGTATVVGSDPGLINTATGQNENAGTPLKANNMYVVTVDNVSPGQNPNNNPRGFRATSPVTVFVWGPYSIT